jgi:hypothetical protein
MFRTTPLVLLLALVSGCSTQLAQTDSVTLERADQSHPASVDTLDSEQNNTHDKASPALCVYETTKGIAEVTEITENSVAFKFYPGDKYFKIPLNKINLTEIKLEQELKAIARTPISGPCENDEFELLTTVE